MTKIVTRTIYGAELQTCKEIGKPHTMQQQSCISDAVLTNYASAVNIVDFLPAVLTEGQDVIPSQWDPETDTDVARTKYLVIGNGGHRAGTGSSGIPTLVPEPHGALDAGPYHLIPFVVRELAPGNNSTDGDLTVAQRARYRLRRILTKGTKRYAAYFARVLDFSDATLVSEIVTTISGTQSTTPFTPVDSNMSPTIPASLSATNNVLARVVAGVDIEVGLNDVEELRSACEILYGDVGAAVVSEFVFCHGVDRTITNQYPLTGTQTPVNRFGALSDVNKPKEVVGLQASIFLSTASNAAISDDIGSTMNLGASEPLYGNLGL